MTTPGQGIRNFASRIPPAVSTGPIFEQEQLVRAVELGLGVSSPAQIELITGDPESAAYARQIRSILSV